MRGRLQKTQSAASRYSLSVGNEPTWQPRGLCARLPTQQSNLFEAKSKRKRRIFQQLEIYSEAHGRDSKACPITFYRLSSVKARGLKRDCSGSESCEGRPPCRDGK